MNTLLATIGTLALVFVAGSAHAGDVNYLGPLNKTFEDIRGTDKWLNDDVRWNGVRRYVIYRFLITYWQGTIVAPKYCSNLGVSIDDSVNNTKTSNKREWAAIKKLYPITEIQQVYKDEVSAGLWDNGVAMYKYQAEKAGITEKELCTRMGLSKATYADTDPTWSKIVIESATYMDAIIPGN